MVSADLALSPKGSDYLPSASVPSPNQQILPITAQTNPQDHLVIGGCDVVELVERFGSPLYILDEETVRLASKQYRESFLRYYPGTSQEVNYILP